jgi:hypothetical protein
MGESLFSVEMILTHGRLAELYGESGQTNESAQQVAEALKWAKESGVLWVTNRAMLARYVARGGVRKVEP